jgi:ankyrin repeat protein
MASLEMRCALSSSSSSSSSRYAHIFFLFIRHLALRIATIAILVCVLLQVHLAAVVGDAACLDALLAAFPAAVDSKDRTRRRATPLHLAAKHSHWAAAKALLAAGASPGKARARSFFPFEHPATICRLTR